MNDRQERSSGHQGDRSNALRGKTGGNKATGRQESFTMRFHFIIFIVLCLSWSSIEATEYKYPYHDPYLATATSAILNDEGLTPRLKSQIVHVPGLPDRNQLPSLEGRGQLSIALYRQNHPAPLLFILAGIGSNPYFGVATYLARLFYQEVSHIVILPSPMSWNFALSVSRSGAPGYPPADARDLYEAMQKSLSVLRDRYNLDITRINFMGVSLGALEGAYLSVIDAEERKVGIEKYLLVNPPLDLSYALKKVDEWDALQEKFGTDKSKDIVAKAVAIVESFSEDSRDNPAVFDRLAKKFASFTREELQFLIAEDLQTLLPELVYVTQVIHDQKVLRAAKDQVRKRLEEAKGLTFMDYNEKIGLPLWRRQAAEPQADLESFIQRGSLARILDRLRGNSRVRIMHNADDPLANRKSIEELKNALGDQVTVYPYGGHLGNLWYSENKEHALRLFRTTP
jgi:pimeloyl-ACP methyl ester carboxylesterase